MNDQDNNTALESFGGQGDTPRGTPSRSDMKIIEQALRREWTIPDVVMEALPSKIAGIFQNDWNTRNRLTAAKILLSMQADNRETARSLMQYHGMIANDNESKLNIGHEITVSQAMSEDDIRKVIDEYRRLHSNPDEDATPEVRAPQAD